MARERTELVGAPSALIERMVGYWTEVSHGRLRVLPHAGSRIVTLPLPRARYVQQPGRLASDAIRAFAAVAEDPADRAALARSPAAIVVFAGTGRESHVARAHPEDPWSNYVGLAPPVEGFAHAVVLAESEEPPFSNFGVLCHEFGHLLGLPELYATGGRPQEGIGVWGLMGQGTWLGRGAAPPHPEAWSKARLGWVDVETVTATRARVRLPAVELEPRVVRIPAASGREQEYYLLENRQRIGADARLPGAGILVWHVDDAVTGYRTAQNDAAHKLLHLVEADGRGDLDRGHAAGGNRGDAGDPWVGTAWPWRAAGVALAVLGVVGIGLAAWGRLRPGGWPVRRAWRALLAAAALSALVAGIVVQRGPVCGPDTPGMAPYDGSRGRVTLRGFSASGPEMVVDVEIAAPDAAPASPPPRDVPARRGWQPGAARG